MRKRALVGIACLALLASSAQMPSATAKQKIPKAGASCSKENQTQSSKSTKFICIKSGKKLLWSKVVPKKKEPTVQVEKKQEEVKKEEVKKPAALPVRPGPVIAPPTGQIVVFNGAAPKADQNAKKSFDVKAKLTPAKATSNVKFWIYDPENTSKPLNSPGVYIQREFGPWEFFATDRSDGGFDTKLEPGNYLIDVVEPVGTESIYRRGKYQVIVDGKGEVTINGLLPNSAGYYTVTLFLANVPPAKVPYTATTKCQIEDKSGDDISSNAFPRAAGRLPNQGVVKALIIPVEFPDLPASGTPASNYQEMAKGAANYFYKQSQKSLSFEFTTLASYVQVNVPIATFKLDTFNETGSYALLLASLRAVEKIIDISGFDVVYVLPPPGIRASQISTGVAYQAYPQSSEYQNATGRVLNGIIGGYDSWLDPPPARWRWMAQVTGFAFGLPVWSNGSVADVFGPWDVLSTPWTSEALEMNSWNKYISGWLADEQVHCVEQSEISTAPKTYSIESLGVDSTKRKSVMIPLSDSRMLVIEARASAGFDQLPENRTGLLSYIVDVTSKYPNPIGKTLLPSPGTGDLSLAVLREGNSLSIEGIQIKAGKRSGDNFEVIISK